VNPVPSGLLLQCTLRNPHNIHLLFTPHSLGIYSYACSLVHSELSWLVGWLGMKKLFAYTCRTYALLQSTTALAPLSRARLGQAPAVPKS
jgi:hypothetical protein